VTETYAAAFPPGLVDRLFALRRDLHRHPEPAFAEHHTAARLEAALADVSGLETRRVAGTGIVGRMRGRARGGPVIAIRGDIDALPIHEQTGVPWASETPGVMHACGHDVHAAWTVGAAHLLAERPPDADVLVVLQPAEETGRGALAMLDAGALDGASAILGAHVDMRFPVGTVVAEPGPLAGSTDEFHVVVAGRGGHAARPHEARDPVVAAAAVISALQTIVARQLAPGEPAVVTVATVHAGTASNVIPEEVVLSGTLRAVTGRTRALLREAVARTAESVAAAHGTKATVRIVDGTPPIVNAPGPIGWAREAAGAVLGADALRTLPEPNLGGEDFAFYLERLPGCFLRIGAATGDGPPPAAHTPRFLPDERAVLVGAAVLAESARRAATALARGG
jgi:amidohydrolase